MPRPSLDELLAVTQPESVMSRRNGEHWVSKLYARRVSVRITRVAVGTRITADAITVTMILVGVASAAALLIPGWAGAMVCAVGVQLYLVLDCVDGEVARWHRTTSPRGEYLDRLGHYIVEASILAAFGWRLGDGGASSWTSIGLLTALLAVLTKAETDLVAATMGKSGTELSSEARATPTRSGVRRLRRLTHPLKVHRITGAVEASLAIVAASLLVVAGVDDAEQWLAILFLAVAVLLFIGHGVSILTSSRLDPDS